MDLYGCNIDNYFNYSNYNLILIYCYLLNIILIINLRNIYLGDWGLGIGDWGLGIGDWAQSPIPNPQSPIPNPQ